MRPKKNGTNNPLDIPHSLLTSPLAVKVFLDALAEIIGEAILQEASQGMSKDIRKADPATASEEGPQC